MDDYRIGIVSETILGVSYRLLLYRPILPASLQVQQLLTGPITQQCQCQIGAGSP